MTLLFSRHNKCLNRPIGKPVIFVSSTYEYPCDFRVAAARIIVLPHFVCAAGIVSNAGMIR